MEQSLVFIHGFLGQATDWQPIVSTLGSGRTSFHCLDLNQDFSISELNFQNWTDAFLHWTKKQKISAPMCLVGYSMGGRLIGPLLEKGFANRAVFLSSQFGLPADDFQQRAERRLFNQTWAQKFLNEPWQKVSADWNQQAIFNQSTAPVRKESDFDRQKLAAMLTGFSISEQKDYSSLWQRNDLKTLYMAGENDLKYLALAQEIQAKANNTQVRIIKNAGHRLLLDQPQIVAHEISNFISVLKKSS